MASYGGAELVAAHITGSELPGYAPAFAPDRFNDADYLQKLPGLIASGQI